MNIVNRFSNPVDEAIRRKVARLDNRLAEARHQRMRAKYSTAPQPSPHKSPKPSGTSATMLLEDQRPNSDLIDALARNGGSAIALLMRQRHSGALMAGKHGAAR
jgi:hypothetical protein